MLDSPKRDHLTEKGADRQTDWNLPSSHLLIPGGNLGAGGGVMHGFHSPLWICRKQRDQHPKLCPPLLQQSPQPNRQDPSLLCVVPGGPLRWTTATLFCWQWQCPLQLTGWRHPTLQTCKINQSEEKPKYCKIKKWKQHTVLYTYTLVCK